MRTENKPKEHSKYKTRTLTNKLIFPSTRGHHKTYMGVGDKWEQERGPPPVISSLQSVVEVRVTISNVHPKVMLDNCLTGHHQLASVRSHS